MSQPFDYPTNTHVRRHGPRGYADYASYRPWLRDEFNFRCVYCLCREAWSRVTGMYDVDHFQPAALFPGLATEYDNLLYSCATCNAIKGDRIFPNPLSTLVQRHVTLDIDGRLVSTSSEASHLIELLRLNNDRNVEFRKLWIGIVRLARQHDPHLFQQLMGFPKDLPNPGSLNPPSGNSRPTGIDQSCLEMRKRGELPSTY